MLGSYCTTGLDIRVDRLGSNSATLPSDLASSLDLWSDCNCWFVFTSSLPSSSSASVSGSRSVSVSGGSSSVVTSLGSIALTRFGRKSISLTSSALSSSSSIFLAGSGWGINGWTCSSASR